MIHVLHGVIVIRMYVENQKGDRKKSNDESVVVNDLQNGRTFKSKALIILITECIIRGVQI